MPSVIIPADNEEAVIARGLDALLDGLDGDWEVVVVGNGCTDRTIEVASRFVLDACRSARHPWRARSPR